MKWLDLNVDIPEADEILCCADKKYFICERVITKWGATYIAKYPNLRYQDCTHWAEIEPPEKE